METEGRVWLRNAIPISDVAALRSCVPEGAAGARLRPGDIPDSAVETLSQTLEPYMPKATIVRAVAFDKTDMANWSVGWHQDRVICVADRHDVPGFDAWTQKAGFLHCQPPTSVLRKMIFARIFLDEIGPQDGGMEFAVGDYSNQKIPAAEIEKHAAKGITETEIAQAGDVLLLKMLTPHRSKAARTPRRRRVLRLDFANFALESPLQWKT